MHSLLKLIYFLFFTFLGNAAYSQNAIIIKGRVEEKSTEKPLAYVNIFLSGINYGTVTNQSGNFILTYTPTGKEEVIVFSHLGYKSFQMLLQGDSKTNLIITLEQEEFHLNEIVVQPLDPIEIVYESIRKFSKNYNHDPHVVQGFQREFVKQSENYIQLLEVSFKTSQGLDEIPKSNILDGRFVEDKEEKDPLWSSSRGGFYTFGWTSVSGIENPKEVDFLGIDVSKKNDLTKYYEFQLMDPIIFDEKDLHVVEFDQKKGIKRSLLKGTLYIDSKSHAIVKMTYELSPRGIKHLNPHETFGGKKISETPKRLDIRSEKYEVNYRKYGSKYYLNTLVIDTDFNASLVFFGIIQSQKESLKLHSERVVTFIDTIASPTNYLPSNIEDIGSIPTLQNFIKKNFENYDSINDEKWVGANFIQSDTSIAQIANELYMKNQNWESFKEQQTIEKALAGSIYTKTQLNEDLDYLKESLERIHPGLYWYAGKNEMDNLFESARGGLKKRNTEEEFYQLISPLIENIHCGHTIILPSTVKSEYFSLYSNQFPLDVWINGDSAFVIKAKDNVSKGSVLLGINGFPMPKIINHLKQRIPSDGFNETYKNFKINIEFPALFARYFSAKDTFELEIQDSDGQINNVKIIGKSNGEIQNKPVSNASLSMYGSIKTALLTIPSFSPDQDLPLFFEKSFEQIETEEIENLIIDIRNNEGGKDEYGSLLFSYISSAPFRYYENLKVATVDTTFLNRLNFGDIPFNVAVPNFTSNIQKQDGTYFYTNHTNLKLLQPMDKAFKGDVYILINGGTFSSAAEFASMAHHNKRAVFIGEEAGGGYLGNCSLGTPTLTLPQSKIRILIPLAKYELAVKEVIPFGHGVLPDFQTSYTLSDILQNTDKDLELCLEIIGEN